ncbi:MAG: hypothetical protein Q4B81_00725 [Moraxella sp.]|nr:hypothetical protein [Moraxella sp.]
MFLKIFKVFLQKNHPSVQTVQKNALTEWLIFSRLNKSWAKE